MNILNYTLLKKDPRPKVRPAPIILKFHYQYQIQPDIIRADKAGNGNQF